MNELPYIAGSACVAAYCAYALGRRGRGAASYFSAAALALQTAALITEVFRPGIPVFSNSVASFVLDMAGAMFWLLFARRYQAAAEERLDWPGKGLVFLGGAAILGALIAPDYFARVDVDQFGFAAIRFEPPGMIASALLCFILLYAMIGLESTYVSAKHGQKWMVKFVLVGAGTAMAGALVARSYGMINPAGAGREFYAMRLLALSAASLLMLYGWTKRERSVRIKVSRLIAYRSLVLFFFGVYLVAFGLVREVDRYSGMGMDGSIFLVFAFIGGVVLIIALLSTSAQRKIQAFMQRHLYEDKYDYRAEWMAFTERLARTDNDDLPQSILRAYCNTFGLSGAALYLATEDKTGIELAAVHEMSPDCPKNIPCSNPLLASLMECGRVLDLTGRERDATAEEFRRVEARFLAPLTVQGKLEGLLVLGRPVDGGERYGIEDFDLMLAMGGHAASTIISRRLTERFALAREMEALGRISAFIAHDLKNHVYTLSLLLENADKHIVNPEFQRDMLSALGNSVSRMKLLISQLRSVPSQEALEPEDVDLLDLSQEIAAHFPAEAVKASGESVIARADREALAKVLLNITLNGLQAGGEHGRVGIAVSGNNGSGRIEIRDNGPGMSREFIRKEIFRPLRTTKKKGLGIGLFQSKRIVDAHNGTIEVVSAPGEGAAFIINVPLGIAAPSAASGGAATSGSGEHV